MSPFRLIDLQQPVKAERKRARRNRGEETVLRRCHRCRGTGQAACPICAGSGEVFKGQNMFGKPQYGQCGGCYGTKATRCSTCGGMGWL